MTLPPRTAALSPTPDELFVRVQEALAGDYSLERELGRGGMGVVYLAREVRLAREVAIKILPPELAASPERRAQFLREAQTAARLSHPNIVPIHRVDEARDLVYFAMAYVAGETLAERIAARGPLPPHQAARLLRDTAWALTYAHAAGIVHRDVKADNIMIERATQRALVADFGIAGTAHADARSADGHIAGSPHYASPEQIAGQPIGAPSDLYSLGVVGFLALTGRLPFDAPTAREVVAMHLNTRPPSILSLAPTVPVKLAQLVERCLAKRADDRPSSAAAFAEALEQTIEPAREIPAPLRVWVARSNENSAVKPLLALYLGVSIAAAGVAADAVIPAIATGVLMIGGLFFGPPLFRLRRVLGAGYGIEDLRCGVREYWARRREEIAYELSAPTGGFSIGKGLAVFGVSAITTVLLQTLNIIPHATWLAPFAATTGTIALAAGVLAVIRAIRLKTNAHLGTSQIKFYNGKWGERLVRLAGIGLTKRAPAHSLPLLTEIALGRATDALYDALPKSVRKQLSQLPPTVRQLENDATTLRAEIDKLDQSLAALDADRSSSAIAGSEQAARLRVEHDRLRVDLRDTRDRATNRLAATVAALETIRLDLLRLQLGDGTVESVTASLDGALDVVAELGAYADATKEVERSLRASSTLAARTSVP